MDEPATPSPLLELLRACDVPEQHLLADMAGTRRNYLYQIATCRRTPNVALARDITLASERLNRMTHGKTPVITIDQLASMCST